MLLRFGLFLTCVLLTAAAPSPPQEAPATDSLVTVRASAIDSLRAEVADVRALLARRPAAEAPGAGAGVTEEAKELGQTVRYLGLRIFLAVLVLVLINYLVRGTVYVLDRLSEKNAARRLFYKRLVPIARITLWTIALYIVLRGIFRLDEEGLIAAGAAVGVAVGFASQDILKNIFGGLVIVFDQPFQVGDKISVGGTYGEVVGIGLRSTRIVTPDDNLVSVPNAQVVDGQVANANAGALDCQVVTHLYLPRHADEALARRLAYEAASSSSYVYLKKPVVVILSEEFMEKLVLHLKVKAYVLDTRYEALFMSDVTARARAAFRRHGLIGTEEDADAGAPAGAPLEASSDDPARNAS